MKGFLLTLGLLMSMAAGAAVRAIDKAVTVAASLDEAWAAWTTREGITSFFAPDARIEQKNVLGSLKKRFDGGPVDWSAWLEQVRKATPARP